MRLGAGLLLAALGAAAAPAAAETRPLWEFGMGAAALRMPHYRGSDQADNWLLPVPYLVYRGNILRADRDGARAVLLDTERLDFDFSVGASAPTRSRDNTARQGMPDLAPTVEFGPKLNLNLARGADWKVDLRVPVRAVMTLESKPRHIGWSATPVLNLDLATRLVDLGMQAGPLWGDRRLHAYYYDVAPAFATTARPAYRAGAGRAGWQLTLGASRRIGQFWLGAFVRADSVAGAAFEPSPLVRSRHQLAFGAAVSWIFAASGDTVDVPPERGR
ncbi:MipA/OmpV family protein [Piscinibacter defluvii]|uniref:MipA/OmpV family protein n=1 Tax=Piscinibacter defluvii TaxID=1796922 RepID=UPI001F0C6BDD|nr:MipA/OmpV family protein [Piscinibacter defluvii]